ncbi:helix-turn-helix domain-containing protein [Salmonella enterica subsp. enterica serovar Newport]|nr:helix-turn-helix domain-containing protein [Salmonella enterica subsp. enterica serovar Newport]
MTGLDKAIEIAGGKRRLAIALGIKPPSLSRWIHKYQGRVPPVRLIQLYKLTGVTPHELRPDLHPTPTSGIPEDAITVGEGGDEQP